MLIRLNEGRKPELWWEYFFYTHFKLIKEIGLYRDDKSITRRNKNRQKKDNIRKRY